MQKDTQQPGQIQTVEDLLRDIRTLLERQESIIAGGLSSIQKTLDHRMHLLADVLERLLDEEAESDSL